MPANIEIPLDLPEVRIVRTLPKRLRATVREVCTDMYDGYTSAVKNIQIPDQRIEIAIAGH